MFDRFEESARQVVVRAQAAARELGHGHVGTEHQLLGLLADPDGHPSRVLTSLGVTPERVRERVELIEPGEVPERGFLPFTPRTKKVLELALRHALRANRKVAPEHLLLGVLDEGEGRATQILLSLGVDPDAAREALMPFMPEPREAGPQIPRGFRPQPEFVAADQVVRQLLMVAGERALNDGRNEFDIHDLLAVVAEDERAAEALALLDVNVEAMRAALERQDPPQQAAG